MTGISIWQILVVVFLVLPTVLLFGTPLKKAGFSRWWSLLMLIPLVNVVAVWVFSSVRWPYRGGHLGVDSYCGWCGLSLLDAFKSQLHIYGLPFDLTAYARLKFSYPRHNVVLRASDAT